MQPLQKAKSVLYSCGVTEMAEATTRHNNRVRCMLNRHSLKPTDNCGYLDAVENIEIDVDSDSARDFDEIDKGLMDSLMQHIELNAKNTEIKINSEFDMAILALNERRKMLLLEVENEKKKKLNRLRNKRRRCARSFPSAIVNESTAPYCRSNDDSILNTQRDARTIDNLKPLQCGDLKFVCESTIHERLESYGKIESSLASGIHSEAMGFGLNYSFVGDEASFQVVTRNNAMQRTFGNEDSIEVVVKGPNDQVLEAVINTKNSGMHTVKYIPTITGQYKIHVIVNKFELLESPFSCEVLSKETLVFEQGNDMLSGLDDDWVINREETSALLENNDQSGAVIFGKRSFSVGKHGWKVKFTSACTGVDISIGVSQKTRIIDIDTQHTCNFRLNNTQNHIQSHSHLRRSKSSQRKMSTFHRETRTFFVLLDMEKVLLTIICCETEERQAITIPNKTELYPCVFMVHQCEQKICPRPLIAFS